MSGDTRIILDINRTCRTCLVEKSREQLRSLLENDLGKILGEIVNMQLDLQSSLPYCICTECLKIMNLAVGFKNQVRKADTQLRNLIYTVVSQSDQHMTVIYKSFVELENAGLQDSNKAKLEHCTNVLDMGSIENEQCCSEVAAKSDITNINIDIYAVSQEVPSSRATTELFVSEDDTVHTSINKESEVLNINKSAIFINGNISNVIKWADAESNSISLSSNLVENNQIENLNGREVLASEQTLKINSDSDENKKNAMIMKNIEPDTNQNLEKGTKSAKFECNLCAKKFRYDFGFKAHLLKHGIPMVCKVCLEKFDDSGTYLSHTKSHHPDFKPFTCPLCDKNFAVMSTLKKHYLSHSADKKLKKFACDLCGKRFVQHCFLVAHKRSHSGENPYQCDTCKKFFAGIHSLRNHQKIHRGEKKHTCNICEAKFIHRFSLRTHLRTHSGEKPFVCELCSNKFSTSSYLKIHMRTHTSEKPYVCLWCQKNFVSRCALAAHEKSHTGEKKFQCDFCGWRSSRLADLQTHIRTHTGEKPYSCDQCDKSYKTASNLAAHKKTHLGLREHVCHICHKAFGDPRTLKGHIRVHTGETPYQCHICGNRFKQSGQLSAHRKTHRD